MIQPAYKKEAYEGLILSILLHGCETWNLTQELYRRLQCFHNRCVRIMNRINLWHTRIHSISQVVLEARLKLTSLELLLARRRLLWAGQVYRMDIGTRLPRKFLTCWVDNPRPRGRPQFNYGHGLSRDLKRAGVDVSKWHEQAADKRGWYTHVLQLKQLQPISRRPKDAAPEPPSADPSFPSPPPTMPTLPCSSSSASTAPPSPSAPPAPSLPLPTSAPSLPLPTPTPSLPLPTPPRSPSLALFSPNPIRLTCVPTRCSRRLAEQARLAGGRRVYSLRPVFHT